jgi:methionine-rich copper-binding protein CopC
MATLTVEPAADGSSLLRVDLNNPSAVERVRIRLSRPDLGDDLLDTKPSRDGGWVLNGNEVALPGAWHAQVIVRRTNIFDDAQGVFDFNVDPVSGTPSFGTAHTEFFALPIFAHAQYASSTPAANATVQSVPTSVSVTWTQELASIQFTITGPDGSNVVNGPAQINLRERHTASVPIRDVGPGQYFVLWHNVSGDDGDPNDGSFVFTVAGAPAQPTAPTNASPQPAPAANKPVTCVENGVKTKGIADSRVDTYCKRQAIRDQYKGKISELTFNYDLSIGMGLESALKDAMGGAGG